MEARPPAEFSYTFESDGVAFGRSSQCLISRVGCRKSKLASSLASLKSSGTAKRGFENAVSYQTISTTSHRGAVDKPRHGRSLHGRGIRPDGCSQVDVGDKSAHHNIRTVNIALTVAPSSFASCSSTPDTVTLTATCLVPAAQCVGTYQGIVQIRNPANYYGNIPANLKVTIVVT